MERCEARTVGIADRVTEVHMERCEAHTVGIASLIFSMQQSCKDSNTIGSILHRLYFSLHPLPTVVQRLNSSMHTLRLYCCFARSGQYTLYHTPEVASSPFD